MEKFRPYSKIVETNAEARQAALALILQSLREKRGSYIYINNRLEGNALGTIAAVVAAVMGARKSFERDAGKMRTEGDRTEK